MIKLNPENVALAKKIFNLYVSSQYETYDSIVNSHIGEEYDLTRSQVRDYIYLAIKYNLVSDEMAKEAERKALASIDSNPKRSSYNTKKTYEKLFEERKQDKLDFPNGHDSHDYTFKDLEIKEEKQYEQLSLF